MTTFALPLRLVPNKIVRYPGGREIDRFRGVEPPLDDGRPEAWVGSTISVVNAAQKGDPYDGRARCQLPGGETPYLFEVIEKDPAGMLGEDHLAKYGENLSFLVKLLDAQNQLGLQTHPDRPYAKANWDSDFGKAESWYVIGLREDAQEPPYVLLGFKEGVTREEYAAHFDRDDITSMEKCCHKIPVQVGDVFNVEAGVPHAVGAGVFLIEVQEPSDITVGARKLREATPEQQAAHRERLLGAYHYNGCDYEENLHRYRTVPEISRREGQGFEEILIGPEHTPYFGLSRITVQGGAFPARNDGRCAILIVLSGKGTLRCDGGAMAVGQSDEVFIPAAVQGLVFHSEGDAPLVLAACYPPQ